MLVDKVKVVFIYSHDISIEYYTPQGQVIEVEGPYHRRVDDDGKILLRSMTGVSTGASC